MLYSCSEGNGGGGSEPKPQAKVELTLSVTDIADNCATIDVSVKSGKCSKAILIEAMKNDEVTVDPTNEIKLIEFIRANGVEITLPYNNTVDEKKLGVNYFTAVAAVNSEGRVVTAASTVWTGDGEAEGVSGDNSAGDLEENVW